MGGYNSVLGWGLLGLLTWLAILAFFILGSIYFWREIRKKQK
jgi:hypothetical protein